MRDLKRTNAKMPAYKLLSEKGFDLFTPMKTTVRKQGRTKVRTETPILQDLLFVNTTRIDLDPIVELVPTLQYRFVRGKGYMEPMVVRDEDMDRFIKAVNNTPDPEILLPSSITKEMIGRKVRIEGGPLDGYIGNLIKVRGTKKRRLIVEIPDIITATVEVDPDLITFL